ncbi:hypothetical protein DPX16_7247 [Anabarilius grahami]|uniref:Uncharacterized protein n=1 Tax=Anabarilius grahami TaxID=495550 RepID=A0A3N0XNS4_ANAGA|nr:hypothetical protein DPX16_7247 [Anabarilius grahami]
MVFKKYDRWTNNEVQALLSLYAEDEIQLELESCAQSYVTGLIYMVLKTAMETQTATGLGEKSSWDKLFRLMFNVRCFPPPPPLNTNLVTLVPKPRRKEGHAVGEPSMLKGIAVLRRSAERRSSDRQWLPEVVQLE